MLQALSHPDYNIDLIKKQPHVLAFHDIKLAADRIESSVIHTPLCAAKISKNMDYNIYLKCENLQFTGSYADRGIRNIFEVNYEDYQRRGVVVPSTGDTALAAAYHGSNMKIPVTVIMPDRTAPATAQRCSELGADVVLVGESIRDVRTYTSRVYENAKQAVIEIDDPLVIAGLGTSALEVVTQLPELDAVIVPVCSGSLLAATLVACKKLKCNCLVYGAECSKMPKMMKAMQAGKPTEVKLVPNIAEGLDVPIIGENAFATIKGNLDRMLEVDEQYIARAVITMLERERLVVDGAGVCALAAIMQGLVPELKGKRAVCIISSGNIESGRLCRIIQRGLSATGRLIRFAVALPDHRSGLEDLAKVVANENAVLKSFVTEQMWLHSDVGTTWASVVIEAANEEHSINIKERLRETYPSVMFTVTDLENRKAPGKQ